MDDDHANVDDNDNDDTNGDGPSRLLNPYKSQFVSSLQNGLMLKPNRYLLTWHTSNDLDPNLYTRTLYLYVGQ